MWLNYLMNGTNHEREEHIMTQHDITDDDLLDINKGYDLLPPDIITRHTFRQWAINGKIGEVKRLGHKLVVRRGDVLALLQPVDAA
jgi:hypothetical protein